MRAVKQICEINIASDGALWGLMQSCHICAARDVHVCVALRKLRMFRFADELLPSPPDFELRMWKE